MRNVTSWTESEINILVQAWSEVEAKYPLLRCERGTGTLHAKMYTIFSRRSTFPRSSLAVDHAKQHIRGFVLFVTRYDQERRKDGGRLWFELSTEERARRRGLVPRRSRGLTTALSKEAFIKLLKMERVQRWLGGNIVTMSENEPEEAQNETSFLSPGQSEPDSKPSIKQKAGLGGFSRIREFSPALHDAGSPNLDHDADELEEKRHVPVQERSDTSTCSLNSESEDEDSPLSSVCKSPSSDLLVVPRTVKSQGEVKIPKTNPDFRTKHRDCNILLENMMELQNKKMRRAVTKLRADIEGEIQRSSEMLLSIISNQFDDPGSSGDVAFVTKVLNMQKQQVHDRFDQFEQKRARDEAANRALLGQRYKSHGG